MLDSLLRRNTVQTWQQVRFPQGCEVEEEIRQYFDDVAEDWDEIRTGYFDESVRESAIRAACLEPHMTVADIGTGTGFMAIGLAPLVAHVIGIDTSTEMLRVAGDNIRKAGIHNITLRQGTADQLPLKDGQVERVFSNMLLHHTIDPADAVAEMARALAPDGLMVLTDLDKHDQEWMRAETADLWLGFDRDEIEAWMRTAGLADVRVDRTDSCCRAAAGGCSQEAQLSVFLAVGQKPR